MPTTIDTVESPEREQENGNDGTNMNGQMEKIPMNRVLLKAASITGYRFGELSRQHPAEAEQRWAQFLRLLELGLVKSIRYTKNIERTLRESRTRDAGNGTVRNDDRGRQKKTRVVDLCEKSKLQNERNCASYVRCMSC